MISDLMSVFGFYKDKPPMFKDYIPKGDINDESNEDKKTPDYGPEVIIDLSDDAICIMEQEVVE